LYAFGIARRPSRMRLTQAKQPALARAIAKETGSIDQL
jgi:hypothetical protein